MAPDDRELSFFMLLRTNSHLYTGVRKGGGGSEFTLTGA